MEWLLVIIVLWGSELTTIQTPMQSKELCQAALRSAVEDLSIIRTKSGKGILMQELDISATCLRARDNSN